MLKIFGRPFTSHLLQSALVDWESSSEIDRLAMVCNIRFDHRVSRAREHAFLSRHFNRAPTGDELREALDKHHKEIIGPAKLPEFVFANINKNNLVAGHHEAKNLINKDVKLANIMDLNGLFRVFHWSKSKRGKRHTDIDYLAVRRQSNFDKWLDEQLDGRPDRYKEDFVELCLDVVNFYHEKCGPYQPTWVTTWDAFEEYKNFGADCWVQVLGVAKWKPRWQIILKYTVAEAGTLVRPTQIDGGYYAYHFPSPPQTPLSQGGHPMSMWAPVPSAKLLPEYIHKQINYTVAHWGAEKLIDRTSLGPGDLLSFRYNHYDLCRKIYGTSIRKWMPRVI
jgi:hypothetical protein